MEPMKLSKLLGIVLRELTTNGDLYVWAEVTFHGYDDTERVRGPVLLDPRVELPGPPGWSEKVGEEGAFVIRVRLNEASR